jgi:hypothetical protein
MIIYVVCLIHPEEGTEPPYEAFTTYEAAQKYAHTVLPLEFGLDEFDLKEDEDFTIYGVELES